MLVPRSVILATLLLPAGVMCETVLLIPELTPDDVARIDLHDGDIGDWLAVVGEPTVIADDFAQIRPYHDPLEVDFRIWLAWTANPPRIYGAMERTDDLFINHEADYPFYEYNGNDGTIHLFVDADHSGGNFVAPPGSLDDWLPQMAANSVQAQYYVAGVPVGGTFARYLALSAYLYPVDWFLHPPWSDGGGRSFSESPIVSVTEFYFTPFDRFIYDDPELSRISSLTANSVVGIDIFVYDYDFDRRPDNSVAAAFQLVVRGAWYMSDDWADAILLPAGSQGRGATELDTRSWGRVKQR